MSRTEIFRQGDFRDIIEAGLELLHPELRENFTYENIAIQRGAKGPALEITLERRTSDIPFKARYKKHADYLINRAAHQDSLAARLHRVNQQMEEREHPFLAASESTKVSRLPEDHPKVERTSFDSVSRTPLRKPDSYGKGIDVSRTP